MSYSINLQGNSWAWCVPPLLCIFLLISWQLSSIYRFRTAPPKSLLDRNIKNSPSCSKLMWENLELKFESAKIPKTEEERKHKLFFFYFKTFHFYNIVSISLLNEIINCVQRKNQDMYTESCWKMCLITVYWLWIIRSLEIHYPWSILEITLSAPPDDSTDIYLLIKGCQSPKPIKVLKKKLKRIYMWASHV